MSLRILVKFPTRERPDRLRAAIHAMLERATLPVRFLFAIDHDDTTAPVYWMNQMGRYVDGTRVSKVEAINRGVASYQEPWDILVLASDDMICNLRGWDEIVRADMAANFPNLDGCLWYPDGKQDRLCTLPVMGRAYFDRLGYIYHPSYLSLWADNEWHEVAEGQGKLYHSPLVLFRHLHPAWGTAPKDPLYTFNESFDRVDRANFYARKAAGFP